jgi:uncharacterized integral membrane protein (TIGR00697 family)
VKAYRYYDLILGAYVCVVLCANLIGAAKVATVHVPLWGPVTFMAGVLFFPISYFFGDILTEVYGYARDRRVVWSGFAALAFATLMSVVIVRLPPADFWRPQQPAVEAMFGNTPRIACGSMVAFWCGSFVNSYVLAKMKLLTGGRWLWTRPSAAGRPGPPQNPASCRTMEGLPCTTSVILRGGLTGRSAC